jgi:predicted acetyltransferase/N-acetylglutamate synthase-like GNAT family acetyltransferase
MVIVSAGQLMVTQERPDTQVRTATDADVPAVLGIARGLLGWFTPRGVQMIGIDLRTHAALAAVEGGQVVGFLTYFTYEAIGRIGWMGVRRDRHRRGIGRRLVEAFECRMRDLGVEKVEVYTLGDGVEYEPYERTRAFYRSIGFRDYRIVKSDSPSCPEALYLQKVLCGEPSAPTAPVVVDARSNIQVLPAKAGDLPVVENLSRLYIYDLSELGGWRCPDSGLFGGCDEFFEDWRVGNNRPFVMRAAGQLAGFAGVKALSDARGIEHDMQEFFILRKFRRRGVGQHVALRLFEQFRGRWRVRQIACNTPAIAFWRRIIADYTGNRFAQTCEPSPWGEMNVIRFDNSENPHEDPGSTGGRTI